MCVAFCLWFGPDAAPAATHSVVVAAGPSFSPRVLTVTNGDTVVWTGLASFHTVTPNTGVTEPFCGSLAQPSCTRTFSVLGSFGYHCNPHQSLGMTGVVIVVAAPGTPPTVSITNPPNNSIVAAPASIAIGVSAADSDGTVLNVRLMTNGVFAATNSVAPFGFTLTNLSAGFYSLRARAEDNQALSTTSAPVLVRVAGRPVISAFPGTNGPLQFQFTSATGINYVVEQTTALTNFAPVVTNSGNGGLLQFSDANSSSTQKFMRVRLQ
jgi:plastocyanin